MQGTSRSSQWDEWSDPQSPRIISTVYKASTHRKTSQGLHFKSCKIQSLPPNLKGNPDLPVESCNYSSSNTQSRKREKKGNTGPLHNSACFDSHLQGISHLTAHHSQRWIWKRLEKGTLDDIMERQLRTTENQKANQLHLFPIYRTLSRQYDWFIRFSSYQEESGYIPVRNDVQHENCKLRGACWLSALWHFSLFPGGCLSKTHQCLALSPSINALMRHYDTHSKCGLNSCTELAVPEEWLH